METPCCICAQIDGRRENDLISLALDEAQYVRRIAMENASFAVIPSLGPIVPGHTLLSPRNHVKSFSRLAMAGHHNREIRLDYSQIWTDLVAILATCYRKPVHVFEHGSAKNDGRVLCTVDHAHLHLVPTNIEVIERLRNEGCWRPIGGKLDDLAAQVGEEEYLYYLSPAGEAFICTSPIGFESQWMRRMFCDALGVSDRWNWRDDMNAVEADACYRTLRARCPA